MIVTFNIADGEFEYFTYRQWSTRLDQWCEQLLNDGYEFARDMEAEEIVECMYGEEMFFDIVPSFDK